MVMTNAYTFPASMSLATNEDGSTESKDNAVMRELQVGSDGENIEEYPANVWNSMWIIFIHA